MNRPGGEIRPMSAGCIRRRNVSSGSRRKPVGEISERVGLRRAPAALGSRHSRDECPTGSGASSDGVTMSVRHRAPGRRPRSPRSRGALLRAPGMTCRCRSLLEISRTRSRSRPSLEEMTTPRASRALGRRTRPHGAAGTPRVRGTADPGVGVTSWAASPPAISSRSSIRCARSREANVTGRSKLWYARTLWPLPTSRNSSAMKLSAMISSSTSR